MADVTPLLILDIDGTVRYGADELGHFANGPEDVTVFPEALTMMRRHHDAGGVIIGVSNQAGIALGHVTVDEVRAAMNEAMRQAEFLFDATILWCPHDTSGDCWCRKPRPGLVFKALAGFSRVTFAPSATLVVGDRREDEGLAASLGVRFEQARTWRARA